MQEAIGPLGEHDHQMPGVLQARAAPALPAEGLTPRVGLLTRQPVRGRQGKHQHGEDDVHAHRPRGVLGWMPQFPRLFRLLHTAVLKQAAVIIVITGRHGLLHGGIRQQDGLAARPMVPAVPLAHHDSLARGGLAVAAIGVTPLRGRAIVVIGGQPGDPADLRRPPCGPRGVPPSMAPRLHPAAMG
jgi:hypothetical protein